MDIARTVPPCEDARVSTRAATTLDRARIAELTEREQRRLDERTQGSRALYERARRALSGGVASAYQAREPWPIYLSHGRGSHVWDVDGTEMVDFHNGFGSMVQGAGWFGVEKARGASLQSHWSDLNRRPLDYESRALPLSYGGVF